jgi:hypothetical protein
LEVGLLLLILLTLPFFARLLGGDLLFGPADVPTDVGENAGQGDGRAGVDQLAEAFFHPVLNDHAVDGPEEVLGRNPGGQEPGTGGVPGR